MVKINLLHHNKKKIPMTVTKLTIFKQAKILDAISKNNQYYTVIFYKNKCINGKKTTEVRRNSFLATAYRYGTTYNATHPLTEAFVSTIQNYRTISFNQMFQKLKDKYNDNEMLYILSMFDNFINEKKIQALCKKVFYQYRRNGQLKKAFSTLITYAQVRPHDRFASDMIHHIDFQKYKVLYDEMTDLSFDNDALYLEAKLSQQQLSTTQFNRVIRLLQKEDRVFDILFANYDHILQNLPPISISAIEQFDTLIEDLLPDDCIISLWEKLLEHDPSCLTIYNKLESKQAYTTIVHHLIKQKIAIPLDLLVNAIHQMNGKQLSRYTEEIFPLLSELIEDSAQLEPLIHHCIIKLLPFYSIEELVEKLPNTKLPIARKLCKMGQYENNPDEQLALGELYFELEQYEKAIQCFEWEMELNPENPKSLQYLQKSYQAIGDKEQANNYQQLLLNMPS